MWKQLGVVERTGLREVAGRFVHVDCVPERDGGDDKVGVRDPRYDSLTSCPQNRQQLKAWFLSFEVTS